MKYSIFLLCFFLFACSSSDPNADLTATESHSTGHFEETTTYASQETHYNYNGKFVLRRDRSYIVFDYWKNKFIEYNPDTNAFFYHFYEHWKGLENLPSADVTQKTIYEGFVRFCKNQKIEKPFYEFWNNT